MAINLHDGIAQPNEELGLDAPTKKCLNRLLLNRKHQQSEHTTKRTRTR